MSEEPRVTAEDSQALESATPDCCAKEGDVLQDTAAAAAADDSRPETASLHQYHPKKKHIMKYQEQDNNPFPEQEPQKQYAAIAQLQSPPPQDSRQPSNAQELGPFPSLEQLQALQTQELIQQNALLRQQLMYLEQQGQLASMAQLQNPLLQGRPPQYAQSNPTDQDPPSPKITHLQNQQTQEIFQQNALLRQQQLLLQAHLQQQQQRRQLLGVGMWETPSLPFANPFLNYTDAARDLSTEIMRAHLYGNPMNPFAPNLFNNVGRLQSHESLNGGSLASYPPNLRGTDDLFHNVGRYSSFDSLAGARPSHPNSISEDPTLRNVDSTTTRGYSNVSRLSTADLVRAYANIDRLSTIDLFPDLIPPNPQSFMNPIPPLVSTSIPPSKQGQMTIPDAASRSRQQRKNHKRRAEDVNGKEEENDDDDDDDDGDEGTESNRFKPFHKDKWNERLEELRAFKLTNGHCLVPHTFPENPYLARWVKRQRRQFKLMKEGQRSTMTDDRISILNDVGFVWDSHEINWNEKYLELIEYKIKCGNCLVPSGYKKNPQLATWVKCQRRQYRLFMDGKPSSMTDSRVQELNKVGFDWEVRGPK